MNRREQIEREIEAFAEWRRANFSLSEDEAFRAYSQLVLLRALKLEDCAWSSRR